MTDTELDGRSIAVGNQLADRLIRQHLETRDKRSTALRQRGASAGLLFFVGDSWFNYFSHDVRDLLAERGHATRTVAKPGAGLADIAASRSSRQLRDLLMLIEEAASANHAPKAILLSGGGNDVAGDGFHTLLTDANLGLPPLNEPVVTGTINGTMRSALEQILTQITRFCQTFLGAPVPIVLHGYAYPVPDGRGLGWDVGSAGGPWLAPGFVQKGYLDLEQRKAIMKDLIDRLHEMQTGTHGVTAMPGFEHVSHVDLRDTLSTGSDYKELWENELHPRLQGFERITAKLAERIETL